MKEELEKYMAVEMLEFLHTHTRTHTHTHTHTHPTLRPEPGSGQESEYNRSSK